jgi:hypothetical protein
MRMCLEPRFAAPGASVVLPQYCWELVEDLALCREHYFRLSELTMTYGDASATSSSTPSQRQKR